MAARLREGSGEINAPPPQPAEVRAALDAVRPGLLADDGNVELLGVEEDGTVRIALQGACTECPSRRMTVRLVIEPHLRKAVRGVTEVVVG